MSNHGGSGESSKVPAYHTDDRIPLTRMTRGWRQRAHSAPRLRASSIRVLGWVLALLVLTAAVVMSTLLILWPVDTSATGSKTDNSAPVPAPSTVAPALAPAHIAAQFEPQLRAALTGSNWDRALEIVDIMRSVDPDGAEVQLWAHTTFMQYGQALVNSGDMTQALGQFDQALALAPDDAEARQWLQTTETYLEGQEASQAGEWQEAVDAFALAEESMPSYGDLPQRLVEAQLGLAQAHLKDENWSGAVETLLRAQSRNPDDELASDLLATAYRERGTARRDASMISGIGINVEKLKSASADLDAALALRPDDAQARAIRQQVTDYLFPAKRIEVDISKQRVYAWAGDKLVHKYPVSTGLRGQDTATGHFQVLNKIPMAHSRMWKLDMPNWLGIYDVQGIENGFHALPFRPDGSKMWAGLLGQRASYGCIVLGTQAGRTLYKWAEIGTRVDIHN
ncbi:L,D-transpeptidase family protein [Chloroflexota bacterium]